MADEIIEVGGRSYKVVRHFRRRDGKLVQVGVQHIRVGETKKLGRRKRLRLQAEKQSNGDE